MAFITLGMTDFSKTGGGESAQSCAKLGGTKHSKSYHIPTRWSTTVLCYRCRLNSEEFKVIDTYKIHNMNIRTQVQKLRRSKCDWIVGGREVSDMNFHRLQVVRHYFFDIEKSP